MTLSLFWNIRSEFEQGDQIIVHNIKKAERLPGTKEVKKYLGPYTVEEVRKRSRTYHSHNPVSTVC